MVGQCLKSQNGVEGFWKLSFLNLKERRQFEMKQNWGLNSSQTLWTVRSFVHRTKQCCLHHLVIFIQINNKKLELFWFLIYQFAFFIRSSYLHAGISHIHWEIDLHIAGQISTKTSSSKPRKTKRNNIEPKTNPNSVRVSMLDFWSFWYLLVPWLHSFILSFALFSREFCSSSKSEIYIMKIYFVSHQTIMDKNWLQFSCFL